MLTPRAQRLLDALGVRVLDHGVDGGFQGPDHRNSRSAWHVDVVLSQTRALATIGRTMERTYQGMEDYYQSTAAKAAAEAEFTNWEPANDPTRPYMRGRMVEKGHDFQIADHTEGSKPAYPVVLTIRQLLENGRDILVYLNSFQTDDEAKRAAKDWAKRI